MTQSSKSPVVTSNINVGSTEVTAIVVSRFETSVRKKIKELEAASAGLTKSIKENDEKLLNFLRSAAQVKYKDILEALEALDKATAQVGYQARKEERLHVDLNGRVSISYAHCTYVSVNIPFDADHEAIAAASVKANEEKMVIAKELITHRQRLIDLPSLERQFRASMAERVLNESEEGKNFLSGVDGFMESLSAQYPDLKLLG